MHTENSVTIRGDIRKIFHLGAAVGDWANLLPHYRYVTVHSDDGRVKQATMAAWRDRFPVKWRTSQVLIPEENRIVFFHTGGVSRGMYVEWVLIPQPDGNVKVTIFHELSYPFPLLTNWFAVHIVGRMFVAHIAGKTLTRIKTVVETEQESNR